MNRRIWHPTDLGPLHDRMPPERMVPRRPTPFQGTPAVRAELPTLPEERIPDTDPAPPPLAPDWDSGLNDGD